MHRKKTIYTGRVIEVEKTCSFKYKGKHTVRGANANPTPEAMQKINDRNAEKKLRRLLNTNFDQNAVHLVLTYCREKQTTDVEKVRGDFTKFIRRLRRKCKKAGSELKYIAVAEHGARSCHFHIVMDFGNLSLAEVTECWKEGRAHMTPLDASGDYSRLAAYLIKETRTTYNDAEKGIFKKRWVQSSNLKQPEIKIEKVKADSWRETPVAPQGYYVITDSVTSGVSELTGWPYQYYACMRLDNNPPAERRRLRKGKKKNGKSKA
jgi:hypothetical protein